MFLKLHFLTILLVVCTLIESIIIILLKNNQVFSTEYIVFITIISLISFLGVLIFKLILTKLDSKLEITIKKIMYYSKQFQQINVQMQKTLIVYSKILRRNSTILYCLRVKRILCLAHLYTNYELLDIDSLKFIEPRNSNG